MMKNKLSLMEFYQLESLRGANYSDEQITKTLASGDVSDWRKAFPTYDFTELLALFTADEAQFQSVLEDGYQIKFITFPGLRRILEMKFHQIADIDYVVEEHHVTGLQLSADEVDQLKQMLSNNWQVNEEVGNKISITLAK